MIIIKKNRYYCEYCKKSGGAANWIKKHEERCTLNPNRYCGYCHLLEGARSINEEPPKLADLMAILPNPDKYVLSDEWGFTSYPGLEEAVDAVLPKLREMCNDCPACIMAALRQKGIPVPVAKNFDFKKECQSIWSDFNSGGAANWIKKLNAKTIIISH